VGRVCKAPRSKELLTCLTRLYVVISTLITEKKVNCTKFQKKWPKLKKKGKKCIRLVWLGLLIGSQVSYNHFRGVVNDMIKFVDNNTLKVKCEKFWRVLGILKKSKFDNIDGDIG